MKRLLSLITMATLLSCLTADEASAQRNRRQQRWIPQPTFRENSPQPYQNQVDRLERQGRYGRARRIREGQLRRTQQQQRIWRNGGAWGPARRFNQRWLAHARHLRQPPQRPDNMGIQSILPYYDPDRPFEVPEELPQLNPGQTITTDIWRCNAPPQTPDADTWEDFPAADDASIHGPRYAIALVTRKPNEFYRLSQTSLPAVRSGGSSLEALLQEALYF